MENRRQFLKKSLVTCATATLPAFSKETMAINRKNLKTKKTQTALVLWYSQTGHTERYGKIIADVLKKAQIRVEASDIRDFDKTKIDQYDLIVAGTPVQYYNVPKNFQDWIRTIPQIDGTAVGAYSTFGGPGDNQMNTACTLSELLVEKGGIPVGFEMFGNMSTFAPTWSIGNEKRILKYRHLPNQSTYKEVRSFAQQVIENTKTGKMVIPDKEFAMAEAWKVLPIIWGTKLAIGQHTINQDKCIGCETCIEKCPVAAIDLKASTVNKKPCIACMGCVNNCPAGAIEMTFMGNKVIGFFDFMEKNNIEISEPEVD
jgi:flavodoxin/NAD-dependent dihydropyrimidine dehydrogenase PreA subunit